MARAIALEEHARETTRATSGRAWVLGLQLFWSDDLDGEYDRSPSAHVVAQSNVARCTTYAGSDRSRHFESEAAAMIAERRTAEAIEGGARRRADGLVHAAVRRALPRSRGAGPLWRLARAGLTPSLSSPASVLQKNSIWFIRRPRSLPESSRSGRPKRRMSASLRCARRWWVCNGGFVGASTLPFWSYDIRCSSPLGGQTRVCPCPFICSSAPLVKIRWSRQSLTALAD